MTGTDAGKGAPGVEAGIEVGTGAAVVVEAAGLGGVGVEVATGMADEVGGAVTGTDVGGAAGAVGAVTDAVVRAGEERAKVVEGGVMDGGDVIGPGMVACGAEGDGAEDP